MIDFTNKEQLIQIFRKGNIEVITFPKLLVVLINTSVCLLRQRPEARRYCTACRRRLCTLTTDAASELDVLGHDGHTLGVDGRQVGVLEQTHEVGLGSFLKSQDGRGLEAEIGLEVLGNLTDQALEGQLADQQLRGLLVFADLTKSHGTGAVAVGLLHATSCGGGFAGGCTAEHMFKKEHRSDDHPREQTIKSRVVECVEGQ